MGRIPTVYTVEEIADECNAVCIVGYGRPARVVATAFVRAGCDIIAITGTKDRKPALIRGSNERCVLLGDTFDKRLFENEFLIIDAAAACATRTLIFARPSYSPSALMKMLAYQNGMRIFAPMREDKTLTHWTERCYDAQTDRPLHDVVWRKCPVCSLFHDKFEVDAAGGICPDCGGYYRLTSDERILSTFDQGSFEEWDGELAESDPLEFPGFADTIERARKESGYKEAVRCGKATIAGMDVAVCVMESTFMMGSMGAVVGEKITRCVERATSQGMPVVIFSASGGARMQEGIVSLMQMAKVSAALARHAACGLLYLSIICDPTTGGVTASFATQGDIIIAEPHALVGFAGRRVIEDTIHQTLPEDFQSAEFALEHGLIDAIVERPKIRETLARIVALHESTTRKNSAAAMRSRVGQARNITQESTCSTACEQSDSDKTQATPGVVQNSDAFLSQASQEAQQGASADNDEQAQTPIDFVFDFARFLSKDLFGNAAAERYAERHRSVADAPGVAPVVDKSPDRENSAWESVMLARNTHRPTASYYIDNFVDGFFELHGDRSFGDDGAIIGGIGWIDGRAVTVIAEEKGNCLAQRIARNFGCPQPEGYRKAARLMKQAEQFGRPIVCLVDTQGALCGVEAEKRGQGNAIAANLELMATLRVPVVSVVLGEGGSGGALALAVANRVAMQEHAVYSILSPEGFASILWKDHTRAAEAAEAMKMGAYDALALGVVDEVLSEGPSAAHENPEASALIVHNYITRALTELAAMTPDELVVQRYQRFRKF